MTGPAGLPLGYDHTETGAVQAATNYLTWMNSIRIKDKPTADAMAKATAADQQTSTAMIESFDLLRTGLDNVTEAQTEPPRGAYATPQYDGTSASIYMWAPDIFTESGETTDLWSIFEIRLNWVRWGLEATEGIGQSRRRRGRRPAGSRRQPLGRGEESILSRTPADPGEITDSADQEWFEYANAAR